jgi:crossover junction endodeoxyribonuclease RusA
VKDTAKQHDRLIQFFVPGKPATKGSTKSFASKRTGKIVTVSDCKRLKGWEKRVAGHALTAKRPGPLSCGSIGMGIEFFLARPQIDHNDLPTSKPDLDKLTRAILDALTGVLYEDDAQVVTLNVAKRFADMEDASEGASVTLWSEDE